MSVAAELEARHLLLSMQERLARDPYEGLGIGTSSTSPEIRRAFLELTKTYHPARFGRMSHELQRLANEVFLALRGAHDVLAKSGRVPIRPSPPGTRQQTGPIVSRTPTGPILSRTSTGSTAPATAAGSGARPSPIQSTGSGTVRMASGPIPTLQPRTVTPTTGPIPTRPSQPAMGARSAPTPAMGIGHSSPPRIQTQAIPTTTSSAATRPVQSPRAGSSVKFATGASSTATRAPTASGPQPVVAPTSTLPSTVRPNEPELAQIHDLITHQQWDTAHASLQALLARQPASPRYHALISFVRGRKAQLENRVDEARAELARALQFDPNLAAAKSAIAELFTRRR